MDRIHLIFALTWAVLGGMVGCKQASAPAESASKEVAFTESNGELKRPEFTGQSGQLKHHLFADKAGQHIYYSRCEDPSVFVLEKCQSWRLPIQVLTDVFRNKVHVIQFLQSVVIPNHKQYLVCRNTQSRYGVVCTPNYYEYKGISLEVIDYMMNNGSVIDLQVARQAAWAN